MGGISVVQKSRLLVELVYHISPNVIPREVGVYFSLRSEARHSVETIRLRLRPRTLKKVLGGSRLEISNLLLDISDV